MGFEFEFTAKQVGQILVGNGRAGEWFVALDANLPSFDISSIKRVAAFLSQTAHESGNYMQLHENLNYRASGLIATWPKHFNSSNAPEYEHQPEKIANLVYSGHNGNGDEASGDGWLFRGRGPIQITGRENYTTCSHIVYGDDRLVQNPDMLETDYDAAIKSCCWFWNSRKLNAYADNDDIKEITHHINGGYIGLDDRINRYNNDLNILQG